MGGPTPVASARSLPTSTRRGLSVWIAGKRLTRRSIKAEQLEVIERLAREERTARRAGEYTPGVGARRLW
jgi:hypothetical protein